MISRRLLMGGGGSFTIDPLRAWIAARDASGATPAGVACLGTSITAGTGASPSSNKWVTRLQVALDALYGSSAITVNSNGISSATSATFSGTPANIVLGSPDPSLVILELGVNDWSTDVAPATFKTNMLSIISQVRALLVADPSFLLVADYDMDQTHANTWQAYIDKLDEIAVADNSCEVLDLRPAFGPPTTTYLNPDLVHPNNAGHQLFADQVYAAITP